MAHPETYSTFLKNFGSFKKANVETSEVSEFGYIIDRLNRLESNMRVFPMAGVPSGEINDADATFIKNYSVAIRAFYDPSSLTDLRMEVTRLGTVLDVRLERRGPDEFLLQFKARLTANGFSDLENRVKKIVKSFSPISYEMTSNRE